MGVFGPPRRVSPRARFRPELDALEGRLCLSAAGSHDVAASPPSTVVIGDDGSIYTRVGNPVNAGPLSGLGGVAACAGGSTNIDSMFQWMTGRMGGKGDFLVVQTADDTSYNAYIYGFGGANSVATLDIPNRAAAMNPAVVKIIDEAQAIFIEGGAQNEYVDWWQGTPVQAAIASDISRGVPIGGTSAGTDVIGQFVYSAEFNSITSRQALENPFDNNVTLDQGFIDPSTLPFLNNTLLDTHFVRRDRMGRLVAFLARVDTNGWSPDGEPMGIGINEQTALLIAPDGQAQVVANSKATSPYVYFFRTPGMPQVAQPRKAADLLADRGAAGRPRRHVQPQQLGGQLRQRRLLHDPLHGPVNRGVLKSNQPGGSLY